MTATWQFWALPAAAFAALTAIFGAFFLGAKLSLMSWLGVALIGGGAILVAF